MRKVKVVQVVERKPKEETLEELLEGEDEQSEEEREAEQKLTDFQQTYGGKDYRIRVEKFNRTDSEWEILPQQFKLDGFDPIAQLKAYGGGRYRMTLLNEKSKYVLGGRNEIRIAEPIVPVLNVPEQKSALEDPIVKLMLEQMRADKAQFADLMKVLVTRPSDAPKAQGIGELVDTLAKLKGLSPSDEGGTKKMKELLEVMVLVKDIQGGGGESEGGEGLMSDILQAVKVMKETGLMQRGGNGAPTQNPPTPAPVPTQIIPVKTVLEPIPVNPIAEGLKKYTPIFLSWAKRDEDPDNAASFLVDELHAEIVPLIVANYRPGGVSLNEGFVLQYLVDKAGDENEVEKIFLYVPELASYKEWVRRVVSRAVYELTTAPEEDAEAEESQAPGA